MKKIFKLTVTSNLFDTKFSYIFNKPKKKKHKCSCGGALLYDSNSDTKLYCSLCKKSYILKDKDTLIEP